MNRTQIQDQIIADLPERPHGILDLSIRMGKTRITTLLLKKDNVENILWVTPNTKLRDEDIPAEIKKWWNKTALQRFDIICWSSLAKIPNLGHYDTIVLDEIQYITPANAENLLLLDHQTNIIGLTGTMPKHIEKKELFQTLDLKVLKSVHIDEAVDNNIIADYEITVHEIAPDNINKDIKAGSKTKPFMTTEYKQLEFLSKAVGRAMYGDKKQLQFRILQRMRGIYDSKSKMTLAKKLRDSLKGRKLFFCASIKQAEEVCEHRYHSKTTDKDLKAFQAGEIDSIAMVNAGGTGFSYRDVDHFIIVQANSDKRGDVTQKIGRSLLNQGKGYKAQIHICELIGTQDSKWVASALEKFNTNKITKKRW